MRSPTASQGEGGALGEEEARKRGNTVGIRDQAMDIALANGHKVSRAELMPTPNTMDHLPARTAEQKAANKGKGGYANVRETVVNELLPTPLTSDGGVNGSQGAMARKSPQVSAIVHNFLPTPAVSDNRGAARSEVAAGDPKHRLKVAVELLPTTRTSMKNGATQKEIDAGNPKFRIEAVTNWGKFEPAIKRWEQVIGRKAPAPTKPDGKDGSHRLSSAFTEWMMGVPEGWITDCGLSRNDELKACGNGVVPQQAELALRILLEGIAFESTGGGQVNLPTPTVSDIFTDKLASSQQKEGSMHSVTLPQAVRMVADTIETGRPR